MRSASATAVPFTIDSETPTRSERPPGYVLSALRFGTLICLMGSAPAVALETAPTAARPPLPIVEALIERRNNYRRPQAIEHGLARLKMFARYQDDWDSDGARAPNDRSIDAASLYLTALEPWHPSPLTTLDRSGEPIIEFEDSDAGFFGSIKFLSDREVELYSRYEGQPSEFLVGFIDSPDIASFMVNTMKLPTLQ
jgi:hypothetical protein